MAFSVFSFLCIELIVSMFRLCSLIINSQNHDMIEAENCITQIMMVDYLLTEILCCLCNIGIYAALHICCASCRQVFQIMPLQLSYCLKLECNP